MEKEKTDRYKIVITASAETFFYQVVEYLYEHMSIERAEEVATNIQELALSLGQLHQRGTAEKKLVHRKKSYRYILFERTARAQIKIIYYVDEAAKTVYVTDFFPTEKNPRKLLRNR